MRLYPKKIILLFLLFSFAVNSQRLKPNKFERRWAIFHPFAALKVRKISKDCYLIYDTKSLKSNLDNYDNGGKLDAFRHVFFMAAFTQNIKPRKIRKLGMAHEKSNYFAFKKGKLENGELADSLSTVMDLNNNELGFKLGVSNKKITLEALQLIVIAEIKKGEAHIMKRNTLGQYLNCENKQIDLKQYSTVWNIPKCLVRSNFIYSD